MMDVMYLAKHRVLVQEIGSTEIRVLYRAYGTKIR